MILDIFALVVLIILIGFCLGKEINKATIIVAFVVCILTCLRAGYESYMRWQVDKLFKDKNGS